MKEVRLIDANKLKLVYEDWIAKMEDCPIDVCADECQAIYDCIWELNEAPTIDPESLLPHAYDTGEERIFKCSECGYGVMDIYQSDERNYPVGEFNYCPHCGVKIVREK